MPGKGVIPSPALSQVMNNHRLSPLHQWRFGALTSLVFFLMILLWSIDGCTIKSFVESWRLNAYSMRVTASSSSSLKPKTPSLDLDTTRVKFDWISVEMEQNFTANLLRNWLAPGGDNCREAKTVEIFVPSIDGKDSVELTAGKIHEFSFQSVDESGKPVCIGGDYFETDLSGENWKSRPPVKDLNNGTYSFSLQIHPDFAGDYNLTVVLLFRHFQGLKLSPARFAFDRELRRFKLRFVKKPDVVLPELRKCDRSDFVRNVWSGRWTRLVKNDKCVISYDGRYRCLAADFPCRKPWCDGALAGLESNGWVYSSHCSFKLFSGDSAWDCLKNKWIFFWGDSNHVDSIRNLLNFVLGHPEITSVARRFDLKFSNPKNSSESVRITSVFNGHWNETQNYQGLDSLKDHGFRELLRSYFAEENGVPDAMVVNSGLHDGVHWSNLRAFAKGAKTAAAFWRNVFDSVKSRRLRPPEVVFRNTIATGGYARTLAFNPSKMEVYNGVFLEKMKELGLVSGVIDNFDMTYPWHYDNRCNDGVHYGRAPAKMRWRDGEIGHQYFVDLMLVHVLLNALCVR
ncbi:hypothetical protein EUTSA_v10013116mg [Eutrema salsugineum]|uniref:Uncharacterized protein n=1 Tax=Eutrema salsugineum TaxID=72664 RepID=V4LDX5_EUTSA|nr:uncharacterized protein LOC18018926 [Eutrema salsugineum]ESQ41914.1 hypothetical protein EUTSA_v10013116mg [Eutrema salsugineum]